MFFFQKLLLKLNSKWFLKSSRDFSRSRSLFKHLRFHIYCHHLVNIKKIGSSYPDEPTRKRALPNWFLQGWCLKNSVASLPAQLLLSPQSVSGIEEGTQDLGIFNLSMLASTGFQDPVFNCAIRKKSNNFSLTSSLKINIFPYVF